MLPFPDLCLTREAALRLPPGRAHDGLCALQSPAQHHLPLLSSLAFCLMLHKVKSCDLLQAFSSFSSLQVHIFCVAFYCFPGVYSPAPAVLYITKAQECCISWRGVGGGVENNPQKTTNQ